MAWLPAVPLGWVCYAGGTWQASWISAGLGNGIANLASAEDCEEVELVWGSVLGALQKYAISWQRLRRVLVIWLKLRKKVVFTTLAE